MLQTRQLPLEVRLGLEEGKHDLESGLGPAKRQNLHAFGQLAERLSEAWGSTHERQSIAGLDAQLLRKRSTRIAGHGG
jgi:hypothetical protein